MQAIRQVPGRFGRKILVRAIPIDTRGGLPEPGTSTISNQTSEAGIPE